MAKPFDLDPVLDAEGWNKPIRRRGVLSPDHSALLTKAANRRCVVYLDATRGSDVYFNSVIRGKLYIFVEGSTNRFVVTAPSGSYYTYPAEVSELALKINRAMLRELLADTNPEGAISKIRAQKSVITALRMRAGYNW